MDNLNKKLMVLIIVVSWIVMFGIVVILGKILITVEDIQSKIEFKEIEFKERNIKLHECWNNPSGNLLDCLMLESLNSLKGDK